MQPPAQVRRGAVPPCFALLVAPTGRPAPTAASLPGLPEPDGITEACLGEWVFGWQLSHLYRTHRAWHPVQLGPASSFLPVLATLRGPLGAPGSGAHLAPAASATPGICGQWMLARSHPFLPSEQCLLAPGGLAPALGGHPSQEWGHPRLLLPARPEPRAPRFLFLLQLELFHLRDMEPALRTHCPDASVAEPAVPSRSLNCELPP